MFGSLRVAACLSRTTGNGLSAIQRSLHWDHPLSPKVLLAAAGVNTTAEYPILAPFLITIGAFAVTWTLTFLVRLARAPVELDRQKLDPKDLEHLLFGFFLARTFTYRSEIVLCKDYKGKFEIEQLREFDTIRVQAKKVFGAYKASILPFTGRRQIRFPLSRLVQRDGRCERYLRDPKNLSR